MSASITGSVSSDIISATNTAISSLFPTSATASSIPPPAPAYDPTTTITAVISEPTTTATTSRNNIFPSNWSIDKGGSDLLGRDSDNQTGVAAQIGICAGAGLIFFIAFCFLRTRLPVIFAPRTNMKRHKPPPLPDSLFGWILPLIRVNNEKILKNVGLDAVLMLQFIVMSIKIFSLCSIFGIVVLIPLSLTSDMNQDGKEITVIDRLSINAIPDESNRLIAYFIFVYFFTFVTFHFLTQSYHNFISLRSKFILARSKSIVSRSILVTGIPRFLRTDQSLAEYYDNLDIGPVEKVNVVRTVHRLDKIIKKRAEALLCLEKAYAKYWGNPCRISSYDPDKVLDDTQLYNRIQDLAELRDSSDSDDEDKSTDSDRLQKKLKNMTFFKDLVEPTTEKNTSKRPTVKTGYKSLYGEKLDAIEYYTLLFNELDKSVIECRQSPDYESTNVAFVTFKNISSAIIASQIAINHVPFNCRTSMAYEPRDVLWRSIAIRGRERIFREIIVWLITTVLVIFWFVPVMVLSSLLSINMIRRIVPPVAVWIEENTITRSFMTSFVPTVVLKIVTAVLPRIFDALGYYQGLRSRSSIAEATLSKYFFFLVFFTLFLFTLVNTGFKALVSILANDPVSVPTLLANSLSSAVPFFMNYVILQGFLIAPLNLLLLGALIVRGFHHVTSCRTPRQHAENRAPWAFNYGIGYPIPLLIFIVVLEYSTISPLMLLFGTFYFCITYVVYKYQFLYVYFRPYEAAGKLWIMTVPRVIFGLLLFQLTMCGIFAVRSFYVLSILCVPLMLLTFLFRYYLHRAYYQNGQNLPLQLLKYNNQKLPSTENEDKNIDKDTDDDTDDTDEFTDSDDDYDRPQPSNMNAANSSANIERNIDNEVLKSSSNTLDKWKVAAKTAVNMKAESMEELTNQPIKPRRRKIILDEDDYEAAPDGLTDYRQPPMKLNRGILDTGLKNYNNPAFIGILPQLWLPVKALSKGEKAKPVTKSQRKTNLLHSNEAAGHFAQHLQTLLVKVEQEKKRKISGLTDMAVDDSIENERLLIRSREKAREDAQKIIVGKQSKFHTFFEFFRGGIVFRTNAKLHGDESYHSTDGDIDLLEKGTVPVRPASNVIQSQPNIQTLSPLIVNQLLRSRNKGPVTENSPRPAYSDETLLEKNNGIVK
ncbi:hypothetical protein BDB01DRAFT_850116 [Pilobolus umbonatus]|nr:hypothetical protein BDB01DRAFT_850116 [Pilobolus umbonatus]